MFFEFNGTYLQKLEYSTIRHKAVFMRGPIRRLPPGSEQRIVAEQHQEQPLELLPEDDVDDEVDARVNRDQQIAGVDQDRQVPPGAVGVDDVDHQRQQVAHEEHRHHAQEHGGQTDLAFLEPGEALPLLVGLADLEKESR